MNGFERLEAPPDDVWSRILESHSASVLHHPAVHRVDNDPESLHHLVYDEEGRHRGCALGVKSRERRFGLPIGGRNTLTLPSAPALDPGADRVRAREALLDHVTGAGFDRLVVHPASSNWLVDDPELSDHRADTIVEFVLDLSAGIDAIRAGYHKTHRKNARRARRDGIEVAEDNQPDALLRLRQMQMVSSERASERTEGFAVREEEYFRRVQQEVYATGLGHVLFASLDGEAIAALAWLQLGERAQTVRSGSRPEGYRTRAMYLLYDALIERLIEEGVTELNAGGVPDGAEDADHPQSGLHDFKAGFGGEARRRHGLNLPLAEVQP